MFDVVKDVGRKVFSADAEATDLIREHLDIKTSGISNLGVEFDDGVARLSGNCPDQATRDLAIQLSVTDDQTPRGPPDDARSISSPASHQPPTMTHSYGQIRAAGLNGMNRSPIPQERTKALVPISRQCRTA